MAKQKPFFHATEEDRVVFGNKFIEVQFTFQPPRLQIKDLEKDEIIITNALFGFDVKAAIPKVLDDLKAGKNQDICQIKKAFTCDDLVYAGHDFVEDLKSSDDIAMMRAQFFFGTSFSNMSNHGDKKSGVDLQAAITRTLEFIENKSYILITCRISNKNVYPVYLENIKPLIIHDGGNLLFDNFSKVMVYSNGYQSWSLARAFKSNEKAFQAPLKFLQNIYHYRPSSLLSWLFRPSGEIDSNGVLVLTDVDTKKSITIGFTDFKIFHGELKLSTKGKKTRRKLSKFIATAWCEGKKLRPSMEITSPPLYIQHRNNYPNCLDEYSNLVASEMEPVFWKKIPVGYCTWYFYFDKIDENEAIKNLKCILNEINKTYLNFDFFQLDDGYQETRGQCGDWKVINPKKFPRGLKPLFDAVAGSGLLPGLWIAPFNASVNSRLAKINPGILLKDDRGKPVKGCIISFRTQFSLDITDPNVKKFLADLFDWLIHDLRVQYIKIDFVYSGILNDGQFCDKDISRVEAYRMALQQMRDAIGPDVFLLGCGAPVMESIGLVNGMRISPDTAPSWSLAIRGMPRWFNNLIDKILMRLNLAPVGMKYALINTITRSWMNKRFWINDPDCVLIRTRNSNLVMSEIQTELSIIG
ncbi:MAG: glycoside hydrolase family 36 protein, partial [Promethearchaeota archaeon]